MTTKNERLKLMLWTELFDNAAEWFEQPSDAKKPKPGHNSDEQDDEDDGDDEGDPVENPDLPSRAKAMLTPLFLFAATCQDQVRSKLGHDPGPPSEQVMREISRQWRAMSETEKDAWRRQHDAYQAKYRRDVELWIKDGRPEPARLYSPESSQHHQPPVNTLEEELAKTTELVKAGTSAAMEQKGEGGEAGRESFWGPPFAKSGAMESASEGLRKLQEGKKQLLKRLESIPADRNQGLLVDCTKSPVEGTGSANATTLPTQPPQRTEEETEKEDVDEEEEDEEDEEESEEDGSSDENEYGVPDEDGRGLLTDVPLILGPNEIEVLPMIIMNGLVSRPNEARQKEGRPGNTVIDMPTIRCHLLLAHENGRNLLRELLIFVAAWDLREEELYFKFMVQIMESIVQNGLMPFAYGAFKE